MTYLIEEHKHRFAAWAASRAANPRQEGRSFTVEEGRYLIEKLWKKPVRLSDLPSPEKFDNAHREWRRMIVHEAKEVPTKYNKAFKKKNPDAMAREIRLTDGIAAKLINVYLKSIFVCGGHEEDACVKAIHPPIDSNLLSNLEKKSSVKFTSKTWTKFTSVEYQDAIDKVRTYLNGEPLWKIEKYWDGNQ